MDIPSERSSHSTPTPRGGGIAIVLATVFTLLIWSSYTPLSPPSLALLILPVLMGMLGVLDDFINLGIRLRLGIQFLLSSAGAFLCMQEQGQGHEIFLLVPMGVLALMWSSNLYNFMDGINGIAAGQAICVCLTMGTILYLSNSSTAAIILIVIGFSCAGFLYWNFPTAKIFMGDSGSLFLGFIFGLLALKTSVDSLTIAVSWLIAMAVFIVDASYTLGIRLLTKQKFYLPHRSHSYQKLALKLNSHAQATLLICTINLGWLFPFALAVGSNTLNPFLGLMLAYTPLIMIATTLRAGQN